MRVLSQINNSHQKKQKQTNKTKRGAPLLGLVKSIYYHLKPYEFTLIPRPYAWGPLIAVVVCFGGKLSYTFSFSKSTKKSK